MQIKLSVEGCCGARDLLLHVIVLLVVVITVLARGVVGGVVTTSGLGGLLDLVEGRAVEQELAQLTEGVRRPMNGG